MESKFIRLVLLGVFSVFCSSVMGQNIQKHYVAKSLSDGVLYHVLPVTLFENEASEKLTFDLTYKQDNKEVILNFTYWQDQPISADSVQFRNGTTILAGRVSKLYVEPDQKRWKHRYTLTEKMDKFGPFFAKKEAVEAIVYSNGVAYYYPMKKSAWNHFAPIGFKIFEMIKFNETK
ncbi:MAG: hypothetical protein RR330_01060 [Alistipes sp.]